jgi:16S rRNA G527 N7-methylase RsmG
LAGSRELAELSKVDAQVQVRRALESYRSDPALAQVLTEPFIRRMEIFAAALAVWGAKTNLTARPQDPAEIAFHMVDSLTPLALGYGLRLSPLPDPGKGEGEGSETFHALSIAFAAGNRILDFGSGAGFPGLVLASACAALFTLVEARRKRASFLTVVSAEMGLDNVEILATRLAATIAPSFNAVVSRASGPASEFYDIAAHALLPRGLAILYSSPSQRLDLAAAKMAGLSTYHRYRYSLRRGGAIADRALSIWNKPKKYP